MASGLGCLIELLLIVGIYFAFQVGVAWGSAALITWFFTCGLASTAILELFFPPDVAHSALWGEAQLSPGSTDAKPDSQAELVGLSATAVTDLRPEGTVAVEGDRMIGRSDLGFIEKGARVRILGSRDGRLVVEAQRDSPDGA